MLESLHVGRHLVSANILTARSILSPTSLFSETSDAVSPSRGPWAVAGAEHPSCTHRNKVEDCDRNHHRPSEKRSTKSTPPSRSRQHRSSDETMRITSPGIIPPFTPREWRGISIGTRRRLLSRRSPERRCHLPGCLDTTHPGGVRACAYLATDTKFPVSHPKSLTIVTFPMLATFSHVPVSLIKCPPMRRRTTLRCTERCPGAMDGNECRRIAEVSIARDGQRCVVS